MRDINRIAETYLRNYLNIKEALVENQSEEVVTLADAVKEGSSVLVSCIHTGKFFAGFTPSGRPVWSKEISFAKYVSEHSVSELESKLKTELHAVWAYAR